jgi:hypothetical protein
VAAQDAGGTYHCAAAELRNGRDRQRASQLGHNPAAVIVALRGAGYLHISESRRDHTPETLSLQGLD